MRKNLSTHITPVVLLSMTVSGVGFAKSTPERTLEVRAITRDGENHLRIYASAFENDAEKKFPITTLDSTSFMLSVDGRSVQKPNFSLTTFSAIRKRNTRAIVWIYDASGVKTIKNLTRELRTLAAQEFPQFQSDYLSIAGVAAGKNFERVSLDPHNQENITALQRQLTADKISLQNTSITREPPVCLAARKFSEWQKRGLLPTDQKTLILMGGSVQPSEQEKNAVSACAEQIRESGVVVYQVIFARPENYNSRVWIPAQGSKGPGSNYRVVDLGGASRALQTIRSSIESEYIITAEVPPDSLPRAEKMILKARYHGSVFQTEPLDLPKSPPMSLAPSAPSPLSPMAIPPAPQLTPQQRMVALPKSTALAFGAWFEWLATAMVIGIIVTIRHIQRINTGIIEIQQGEQQTDVPPGPLLIVLNGRDKGREFRIRRNKTLLGRGWNCDIRLQPLKVRGKHGEIEIDGDKAILRDLSEGNLFVNGRVVRSLRVIGHGSVIRMGDLQLLFQCGES